MGQSAIFKKHSYLVGSTAIVLKEPNPLRERVISFPAVLPKEFDLHKFINYDEQFDKSFLEPLRFIVNAIGWNFEKQATLDNFF